MQKQDAARRERGRPTTRNREEFMFAIWSAVQEEIHVRGAPSARQACERLFLKRADGLIKFVDEDGELIDVINGVSGADTLRQRYQTAERCRHDAEKFPHLHQRAIKLLDVLPGTFERLQAVAPEMRWRKATNNWLDDYPG